MPARRPVTFKCEDCEARFMRPRAGGRGPVCPFCGSFNFNPIATEPKAKTAPRQKPNPSGWKYTGVESGGLHLYRNDEGRERWLQHGAEALPHPAGAPDPNTQTTYEKSLKKTHKQQKTKKKQSDYRKRRYQLMKEGKWKGSMQESETHDTKKAEN